MATVPRPSVLDRLTSVNTTPASKAVEATLTPRKIVTNIAGSQLSQRKPRAKEKAKEGCVFYTLRNLPKANKPRFDAVVESGQFRESYNQFMLDAINEKLAKMERAAKRADKD